MSDRPAAFRARAGRGDPRNPAVYELAELVPEHALGVGTPARLPDVHVARLRALLSVYGSARQVEAELAHPLVWDLIRTTGPRADSRTDPDLWLPERPMRRHHYLYGRNRYLTDPDVLAALAEPHRELAADQARELGLLDPDGRGSWTHPDLTPDAPRRRQGHHPAVQGPARRHARRQGDRRDPARRGPNPTPRSTSKATARPPGAPSTSSSPRAPPRSTAGSSSTSNGSPTPAAKPHTAMDCFTRLAPHVPGAQGVIYDTALRGVHHQHLLRDLGLAADQPGHRREGRREEAAPQRAASASRRAPTSKTRPSPRRRQPATIALYAPGGALGIGELTDTGDLHFVALPRVRTHRNRGQERPVPLVQRLPAPRPATATGTITVRLHGNDEDAARKLNRTENVRPIPPADPDFERLFPRRNDAESINRHLDDTIWLGRAHSIGHDRQHLNLLGYALIVNALALHRHRRRRPARRSPPDRPDCRRAGGPARSNGLGRQPTTRRGTTAPPRRPETPLPYLGSQPGAGFSDHSFARPRPRSSGDRASVS